MHKKHEFSRVVAGTMNWGVWGSNLSSQEMAEMITMRILSRHRDEK